MSDNALGIYRAGFGIFKKLIIYPDKVTLKGLFTRKIIPASKIANVSINKLTSKINIETSGGEITTIFFSVFAQFNKLDEIQEKIISISSK